LAILTEDMMKTKMKWFAKLWIVLLLVAMTAEVLAAPAVRIKDIAHVQGVRDNQLTGYGLVVGLTGTGDSDKTFFTAQSIAGMLKTFGITVSPSQLKVKNVAAVMVTATLPPFGKSGDTIDVTVSSLGDAKSLQGGTLVMTPLRAGNGATYAVAQGAVSIGGFSASGGGSSASKNFQTVGRVPNGALIER
jgi:flagellar P-ring protein FlgI